jgi:hypothetical protein
LTSICPSSMVKWAERHFSITRGTYERIGRSLDFRNGDNPSMTCGFLAHSPLLFKESSHVVWGCTEWHKNKQWLFPLQIASWINSTCLSTLFTYAAYWITLYTQLLQPLADLYVAISCRYYVIEKSVYGRIRLGGLFVSNRFLIPNRLPVLWHKSNHRLRGKSLPESPSSHINPW